MTAAPIPQLDRRRLLGLAAAAPLLAACGATPAPAASSSPAADVPVVGLTYIPNIQFCPFYVADRRGLFDPGVRLRHHGADEGLFTALTTGVEDVVVAGGAELLQARAEGMDLVAVASYYRRYPVRIVVPEASPIQAPADLRGRRVGVPGRYGESWVGLRLALAGAGLAESDISVQEIGYTQQAALATGKVDAVIGYVNGDVVAMRQAGFAARTVDLGDDLPLVSICLVTTRAYATDRTEAVKDVVAGTIAGIKAVVADQPAAVTASQSYVPGLSAADATATATAVLAATVPLFLDDDQSVSGALDLEQWQQMSERMSAAGLLAEPVTVTDAVVPGLA